MYCEKNKRIVFQKSFNHDCYKTKLKNITLQKNHLLITKPFSLVSYYIIHIILFACSEQKLISKKKTFNKMRNSCPGHLPPKKLSNSNNA